ncbi:MAG: hypothetical protein ACFFC9_16810 [Promethearchaeota archaeon]
MIVVTAIVYLNLNLPNNLNIYINRSKITNNIKIAQFVMENEWAEIVVFKTYFLNLN